MTCNGHVMSFFANRITCTCELEAHDSAVPHCCACGGSWFGDGGKIAEVISYPQRIVSPGQEVPHDLGD